MTGTGPATGPAATRRGGSAAGAGAEAEGAPTPQRPSTADVAMHAGAARDMAAAGAAASVPAPSLAVRVISDLGAAGLTLAVAESLTGGLLGAELVSVPGASAVFRGGALTYATDCKASVLGVDAGLLAEHGPVHPQVAVQMADGARSLFGADLALATTGVAGPGPADGQPPGMFFVACTGAGRAPAVRGHLLAGTRAVVRATVVQVALALLLD